MIEMLQLESELESEGIIRESSLKKRKYATMDDSMIVIATVGDSTDNDVSLPIIPNGASANGPQDSKKQENNQGEKKPIQEVRLPFEKSTHGSLTLLATGH